MRRPRTDGPAEDNPAGRVMPGLEMRPRVTPSERAQNGRLGGVVVQFARDGVRMARALPDARGSNPPSRDRQGAVLTTTSTSLDVVIQRELVRVRPQPHRVRFVLALVVD